MEPLESLGSGSIYVSAGANSSQLSRLTPAFSSSHNMRAMATRILSVSYDPSLLATRGMLLEQRGYSVTSALGFSRAIEHCRASGFDLFILGHSIPEMDKLELMKTFRGNCPA